MASKCNLAQDHGDESLVEGEGEIKRISSLPLPEVKDSAHQ